MAEDPRSFFEQQVPQQADRIRSRLPEKVVVVFHIEGEGGGSWQVSRREGPMVGPVTAGPKDCVMRCSSADFMSMLSGALKPIDAFQSGRLVVSGDIGLVLKLARMFVVSE